MFIYHLQYISHNFTQANVNEKVDLIVYDLIELMKLFVYMYYFYSDLWL